MTPAELELQLKLLGISPDVKMVDLLDILQHKQVELNQYDKRLEHMSVTNFKKYPAAKTQLDGDDPFEGEEIRTDIDARSANEQYPRGTIRIAGALYDKEMIEVAAREARNSFGSITLRSARVIFPTIIDGDNYSATEKATWRYLRKRYAFSPDADRWLKDSYKEWKKQRAQAELKKEEEAAKAQAELAKMEAQAATTSSSTSSWHNQPSSSSSSVSSSSSFSSASSTSSNLQQLKKDYKSTCYDLRSLLSQIHDIDGQIENAMGKKATLVLEAAKKKKTPKVLGKKDIPGKCTFLKTKRIETKQKGYMCHDCSTHHNPVEICEKCAFSCHARHRLTEVPSDEEFFCYCGSNNCSNCFFIEEDHQNFLLDKGKGITKAMYVGINYLNMPKGRGQLSGCINDVGRAKRVLAEMGFHGVKNKTELTLIETGPKETLPTKQNIIRGMKWLTEGTQPGDVLWFHFSGHGTQVRDYDGIEKDGQDESLVPLDFSNTKVLPNGEKAGGYLLDDEIHKYLVKRVPDDVTLYCVVDCCHSGTMLDMPFIFDEGTNRLEHDRSVPSLAGNIFMISGCQNIQTAGDLPPGYMATISESIGALSWSIYDTTLLRKGLPWSELITTVRRKLRNSRLSQIPQFEVSCNKMVRVTDDTAFALAFPSVDADESVGFRDFTAIPDMARSEKAIKLAYQREFLRAQKAGDTYGSSCKKFGKWKKKHKRRRKGRRGKGKKGKGKKGKGKKGKGKKNKNKNKNKNKDKNKTNEDKDGEGAKDSDSEDDSGSDSDSEAFDEDDGFHL